MKPVFKFAATCLLLGTSLNATAWWGNNGWDWNPWPVWTPMYWMEEMVGDNDWYDNYYGGPYGYAPYGSYGYGPGYGGYSPYYGGYGTPYYGGGYPYGGHTPYYGAPWRY